MERDHDLAITEQPANWAIWQAALEGLGVIMGPVALISDELRAGRLLAPIEDPVLKTRGYFFYAPQPSSNAIAITALRDWLTSAGSIAERDLQVLAVADRIEIAARRTHAGAANAL